MDNLENNNSQNKVETASVAPAPSQPLAPTDIYVMPEKFHPQKSGSSGRGLLIAVVALIIVVAGSAAYFLYDYYQRQNLVAPPPANTTPAASQNSNLVDTPDNAEATSTAETDESETEPPVATSTGNQLNPGALTLAPDSDRDGLTDQEEALFGASSNRPDSDSDGYLDGDEVVNGYNPAVAGSDNKAKLAASPLIINLMPNFDKQNNFSVNYLQGWENNVLSDLYQARLTVKGTGEIITISVKDNNEGISAANWYLTNHPEVTLSQLTRIETKNGLAGVFSPDKSWAGLTNEKMDKFYFFEYQVMDGSGLIRYPTILTYIIKSLKPEVSPTGQDKTYNDERIAFNYSTAWSEPIFTTTNLDNNGQFPTNTTPNWRLKFGSSATDCSGGSCFDYLNYTLDSLPILNYDLILGQLEDDQLISDLVKKEVNGRQVITYIENGMAGTKVALIFAANQTLRLSVLDSASDVGSFDSILNNLQIK